jgi:hypothetical protein
MHARVNMIFGRQDKVDNGIAHLEETDRLAVEAIPGNRGLTTLADRAAGVIVALSYWDEPVHSSEAALTRARQGAVIAADGDLVVEAYEVASQETTSPPAPDAVVRLTRVQIESARVAAGLRFVREEVLPRLRSSVGFCSAEVLIDRGSGNGLFLTVWMAEGDAHRADAVLDQLRDQAMDRVGARFPPTETYALVRTSARTG